MLNLDTAVIFLFQCNLLQSIKENYCTTSIIKLYFHNTFLKYSPYLPLVRQSETHTIGWANIAMWGWLLSDIQKAPQNHSVAVLFGDSPNNGWLCLCNLRQDRRGYLNITKSTHLNLNQGPNIKSQKVIKRVDSSICSEDVSLKSVKGWSWYRLADIFGVWLVRISHVVTLGL